MVVFSRPVSPSFQASPLPPSSHVVIVAEICEIVCRSLVSGWVGFEVCEWDIDLRTRRKETKTDKMVVGRGMLMARRALGRRGMKPR